MSWSTCYYYANVALIFFVEIKQTNKWSLILIIFICHNTKTFGDWYKAFQILVVTKFMLVTG